MDLHIRPVREVDASATAALLNPIIRAGAYTIIANETSVDDQTAYIRSFPARGVCNVAVRGADGCVVGMQSVERLSGEAALAHVGDVSTFVALDARRGGIGRRLSELTFDEARERGFLKLMAMIRADNEGAVAFYRTMGFRVIGTARHHARIGGRLVDEVIAEKLLTQSFGSSGEGG